MAGHRIVPNFSEVEPENTQELSADFQFFGKDSVAIVGCQIILTE